MWISAAIGEELLFRAFAFAQLKKVLGDKKIVIVLLSALMFCLPHLYQGLQVLLLLLFLGLLLLY
ncbi:CPBP family intramembrane glutamic endopeptidase [Chryseobacterium indoltheticum]|uniref:CPBP family intramembrane glutamic endopeptidase n=1 Tax=Chryseobacterium indoltheticum TaxID=254 RepID=UPI00191240AF|nr:CPBP family intramembrane metalloprotease [Chryseobacterium indoltheticum]